MRDSAKLKSKCKHTNSPSKMHLSTSMSSENEGGTPEDDGSGNNDDVVVKIESTSTKSSVDKNGRNRFWPFGGGKDNNSSSDSEKVTKTERKKSDRKKSKSSETSDKPGTGSSSRPSGSVRRATLEPSASPSVSTTTPRATRVSSSGNKTPTPKARKAPSRFSLRRLFYGNPLLAQPFLQATSGFGSSQPGPSGYQSGSTSNQRRGYKGSASSGGARYMDDGQSDTRSVMRDNISSCSSMHGATAANAALAYGASNLRECPLCLSECTLDQFPVLRNCVHFFCLECLQTYVKIEIQEGRVNLKCPQCTEHMHPNDIESLIGEKNSNLLTLYESLMLRRILAVDPDTRWCPGPNCTFAVIAQGCASCPKLDCERPGCGFSFCYHCKAEWHPNQTCDMARVQRHHHQGQQQIREALRSSSGNFSLESAVTGGASAAGGGSMSEVKVCPRCNVLIVKMDDGSCNHMTCAVCGAEFCWLCMKEISDLHYLSPSGCTFWGKKPWSRKKKLLWQLGTIIGAPVGIALIACISIPAMIIGIPSWVGRKIHDHYKTANKHKRNLAVVGGVLGSLTVSPLLAVLAVSIGVPVLLCYVYAVVPIALCRSDGCGVSAGENGGVRIDVDEEETYRPVVSEAGSLINARGIIANPSIGEMSLGASMSLGSGCHLERDETESGTREPDRESASNTAIAGTSLTGSVASSYFSGLHYGGHSGGPGTGIGHYYHGSVGGHHLNRLEVGADVHTTRKKFSLSSERLSETVSLSERSATVSLAEEGGGNSAAASTRALAGSLLAYRLDSQSVSSYRTTGGEMSDTNPPHGDNTSLRSLPLVAIHQGHASTQIILSGQNQQSGNSQGQLNPSSSQPRSLSPVSYQSGDDLSYANPGRKSLRSRRPLLDKQLSENSSLLSGEDATSERVRFDDNVSFIDDCNSESVGESNNVLPSYSAGSGENTQQIVPRLLKNNKLETPSLPEETPEELAQVISPEPQHRNRTHIAVSDIGNSSGLLRSVVSVTPIPTTSKSSSPDSLEHVTLLSITHGQEDVASSPEERDEHEKC